MRDEQINPSLDGYFGMAYRVRIQTSKMRSHIPNSDPCQHVPVLQCGDYIAPHRYDDGEAVTGCVIDPILEQCGFMTMDEVKRVVKTNCTGIHNPKHTLVLRPDWNGDKRQPSKIERQGPCKGNYERKPRGPYKQIKPFIVVPKLIAIEHTPDSIYESLA